MGFLFVKLSSFVVYQNYIIFQLEAEYQQMLVERDDLKRRILIAEEEIQSCTSSCPTRLCPVPSSCPVFLNL